MADHLRDAISLAESVRYTGDFGQELTRDGSLESSHVHYQFNENGLRLSADLTPGIHKVLSKVCERLRINSNHILAYVYASPDIQAGCYSADTSDCLISFSSALIQLMDENELAFVVGHELGHFLLGHGADMTNRESSTESLIKQRCKEISADRLGMLACPSQDAAFRALIKTTAGLGSDYLRFDIGTYLDQIRKTTAGSASTHPSLIMRCRALLWFSMSREFNSLSGRAGGEPISKVDERLAKDLKKFVDGPAHQRIKDAKDSLNIWLMAAAAIRDGSFDKAEQSIIAQELGEDILKKMFELFSGCGLSEVNEIVRDKLAEAADYYQSIAPHEYSVERPKLESRIAEKFGQSDFGKFVQHFA